MRRQRCRAAAAGDRLAELLRAEQVEPIIVEPPADLADADGTPVVDLNAWAQLDPDWSDDLNRRPRRRHRRAIEPDTGLDDPSAAAEPDRSSTIDD